MFNKPRNFPYFNFPIPCTPNSKQNSLGWSTEHAQRITASLARECDRNGGRTDEPACSGKFVRKRARDTVIRLLVNG